VATSPEFFSRVRFVMSMVQITNLVFPHETLREYSACRVCKASSVSRVRGKIEIKRNPTVQLTNSVFPCETLREHSACHLCKATSLSRVRGEIEIKRNSQRKCDRESSAEEVRERELSSSSRSRFRSGWVSFFFYGPPP
jgi:hypothetical protein